MSTINRHSRRRVVHFDLRVGGRSASATQVLETVAGVPTICKFMVPGITVAQAEDTAALARWRTELDTTNADNFTTSR